MPSFILDENSSLKRRRIALRSQETIQNFFCFILIALYSIRAVVAYRSEQNPSALLLLFLVLFLGAGRSISKWTGDYRHLSFFTSAILLSAEAVLTLLQERQYAMFLMLVPMAVSYCSFMAGFVYGSCLAAISIAESIAVIYLQSRSDLLAGRVQASGVSPATYFLYFAAAQIMMFALAYLFQFSLEKGEEEVRSWRSLRAGAERRTALAAVLGKFAHEVNNPLAILHAAFYRYFRSTSADMQQHSRTDHDHLKVYVDEALNRIQKVVDSLQSFTEGDGTEPMRVLNVRDLISQLQAAFYETLLSLGANLRIEVSDPTLAVYGRPRQILFILSVILENALEASLEPPKRVLLRAHAHDSFVRLEIEDNGVGIPDKIAQDIFQPFVTSKPYGQSMGMNLSICHGLAEEHGGQVGFVRKESGTLFWLDLRRAASGEKGGPQHVS